MLGPLHLGTAEPAKGACEQSPEPGGRVGEGEELTRIAVDRVGIGIADNLIKLGGKMAIGQPTRQHIRPWLTGLDDRS
jgi:hypothetical protein